MWSAVKCSIFSLSVLTLLRACCKSRSEENAPLGGLSGHSVSGSNSWKGCGNNEHFVVISQVQRIWAKASCILSLGKTFCPWVKMKTIAESMQCWSSMCPSQELCSLGPFYCGKSCHPGISLLHPLLWGTPVFFVMSSCFLFILLFWSGPSWSKVG